MIAKTTFVLFAACGLTAFAVGCGGAVTGPDPDALGQDEAMLRRMKSCGELLTELKTDANYKLNHGMDLQVGMIRRFGAQGMYFGGGVPMSDGFGRAEGNASPAPVPGAPSTGSGSSSGGTSPSTPKAQDHSETTTQVAGVDEADFVKADNEKIYLLHGTQLKVLRAWPKESLAELGQATVEGTPSEMFLDGQTLVVYSQVNGASLFRATNTPMRETYSDWGYAASGRVDVGVGAAEPAAPSVPGGSPTPAPEPYYPLTKITVFQLANNVPQVARELYFEGSYKDSRRVGPQVRTVLTGGAHGPVLAQNLEMAPNEAWPTDPNVLIAKLEALRAQNRAKIDASTLADWMPVSFEKRGTQVTVASPSCSDYYLPTTGSTTYGLTQVESIDLSAPTAPVKSAAITGQTNVVYGNGSSLYLAQEAYVNLPWGDIYANWQAQSGSSGSSGSGSTGSGTVPPNTTTPAPPPSPSPSPTPSPTPGGRSNVGLKTEPTVNAAPVPTLPARFLTNRTHVHKMAFNSAAEPGFPIYVGSGTVGGSVDDQYSMDEYQGNLRIATTERFMYTHQAQNEAERLAQPDTENHVRVLGAPTPSLRLPLRGDTGKLAPGERIYSTRFMEGKGYLVTFRQVDPLFALDLSNPNAPRVTGELKIPGFSEFMVPMDANHLLTIGRDATPDGRVQGLALQIFDVTNPAQPVLAHKFAYASSEYGYSDALYDPKAFTFFKDRGLLAFPYYAYGRNGMRSSLEVFRVNAQTGFVKSGSLDHSSFFAGQPNGYACGYYQPSVRRGVFLEDVIYSISYGGVIAQKVDQLGTPGAKLPLSTPAAPPGYPMTCGGSGGGGVPGTDPVPPPAPAPLPVPGG